jgi:nitric oxide reductase NorE protein
MLEQPVVPAGHARRIPGEEGAWLFIFGDMLVFAVFFLTYVWYRAQQPGLYDQSQLALDQAFGLVNTLLLLSSSWLLALGVRAFRLGFIDLSRWLVVGTIALGGGFVISKAFEWSDKFAHGITVMTNDFFMFYFMFTGIHLFHVLIGLGVLAMLHRLLGRDSTDGEGQVFTVVESAAAFWHLVDLLWIVLFALIYLMR